MTKEQFYQHYADTPLDSRFVVLDPKKLGMTTLAGIWEGLRGIDDKLRADEIRREKLLEIADWYLGRLKKGKGKTK